MQSIESRVQPAAALDAHRSTDSNEGASVLEE